MGAPVELSPSWSLAQAHERPPRHPLSSSTGHLPPPPHAGKGSWLGSLQHLSCQKMKRFGECGPGSTAHSKKEEVRFLLSKSITRYHAYLGAAIPFLFL